MSLRRVTDEQVATECRIIMGYLQNVSDDYVPPKEMQVWLDLRDARAQLADQEPVVLAARDIEEDTFVGGSHDETWSVRSDYCEALIAALVAMAAAPAPEQP